MAVLLETSPVFAQHQSGPGHPERPERLDAVLSGIRASPVAADVVEVEPRPATPQELAAAHPATSTPWTGFAPGAAACSTRHSRRSALVRGCRPGRRRRAGRGRAPRAGRGHRRALRRPPARPPRPRLPAMGFCLVNSVAVAAAALAERGHQVVIVDWDAHHGTAPWVLISAGYDALAASATTTVSALAGVDHRPEPPTSGGPSPSFLAR